MLMTLKCWKIWFWLHTMRLMQRLKLWPKRGWRSQPVVSILAVWNFRFRKINVRTIYWTADKTYSPLSFFREPFGAENSSASAEKKEILIPQLITALQDVYENIKVCEICGNYDTENPCSICRSAARDTGLLCVVQDISDLWALERGGLYKGRYHVLGGVLSAIEGITPEDLNIDKLVKRIETEAISEIILALPATVDGQITMHYISSLLKDKI